MVREIWGRAANGCGHRQVRMCLVHEFGRRVSAKSVPGVMRRMGLRCRIRAANPWRRYSSYRGETGGHVHNLLKRCVCSIESGPCERVESLQMSGRF